MIVGFETSEPNPKGFGAAFVVVGLFVVGAEPKAGVLVFGVSVIDENPPIELKEPSPSLAGGFGVPVLDEAKLPNILPEEPNTEGVVVEGAGLVVLGKPNAVVLDVGLENRLWVCCVEKPPKGLVVFVVVAAACLKGESAEPKEAKPKGF